MPKTRQSWQKRKFELMSVLLNIFSYEEVTLFCLLFVHITILLYGPKNKMSDLQVSELPFADMVQLVVLQVSLNEYFFLFVITERHKHTLGLKNTDPNLNV